MTAPRKYDECQLCGRSLLDLVGRIKFCSDECRAENERRKRIAKARKAGVRPKRDLAAALALTGIALANPREAGRYVGNCEDCGAEIRSVTGHKIVCADCRKKRQNERQRKGKLTLVCEVCAARFAHHNPQKKYCSRKCANAAIAARKRRGHTYHTCVCVICADQFISRRADAVTCSDECRAEKKRRDMRVGWVPEQLTCRCGTKFTQNVPAQIHCCERCNRAAKNEKDVARSQQERNARCRICGKSLVGLKRRKHYCSDACYSRRRSKK